MEWAFAMGAGQGGAPGGTPGAPAGGMLQALFPLLLMFLVFYFLLIRPQQKRVKQHKELLANLKRGDEVVTTGGIHGKITGITENVVTLEIADNVRIKVQRDNISGLKPKGPEKPSS
jgi:preprotein translocase subunit YajC